MRDATLGLAVLLLTTPVLTGCLGASDHALDSTAADATLDRICPLPCERALLDEPHGEYEPSIAVNPTDPDNVVVGVYEAPWDLDLPGDDDLPLVREPGSRILSAVVSHDGGATWTRVPLPYLSTAEPDSRWNLFCSMADPVVFFGPEGTAYFVGLGFGCSEEYDGISVAAMSYVFLASSDDGGLTWSEPSIVWQGPRGVHPQDKPWGAVDPGTGTLAISWSSGDALSGWLVVSVSTDGGTSWSTPPSLVATSTPVPVPGAANEQKTFNYFSIPAWGANGALHVAYRACNGSCYKIATSPDLGQTWETREATRVELEEREAPRYVANHIVLDVDRSGGGHDGRLYISYADASHGDYDVVLKWSDDGARSWSEAVRLNDNPPGDGTDQFDQWMDVDEAGVVHAFFLDRRNDPENLLVQATYARYDPTTGGLVNEHMSEAWHLDPNDAGRALYGDYEALAAAGGTVAMAWTRATDEPAEGNVWRAATNIHAAVLQRR